MAFQQPQQRPQPSRHISLPKQSEQPVPVSPARTRPVEESQEWILFSPQNDGQSISQTSQTPRTATHLSDFGSLETHVRSQPIGNSQDDDEDITCQGTEDDDGAELDSLDDGLHAFHHPFSASSNHLDQSGGTVLPTHDGFGTFPSSSAALQEQLWQFERHNPHRKNKHARRRSSVQRRLDLLEEEENLDPEDERTARIERWRLDQSRAVLEEIERETRRRRRRLSRMSTATSGYDRRQSVHDALASKVLTRQDSVIPEEPQTIKEPQQSESFWRRITRKVIQDLIGLDENTLSVIFGEQLVDDASPTPTQPSPIAAAARQESRVAFHDPEPTWEIKLLDRIARELGILVHQLAEYDGTAFNTYKNAQQEHIDYAGLPRNIPRQPSLRQRRRLDKARNEQDAAQFPPTIPQSPLPQTETTDSSLWGIEEEPDEAADENLVALQQEREYWEKDVDVKMIFNYLKTRFSSAATEDAPTAAEESSGPLPASWVTSTAGPSALSTSPEGLRRAEIIKQQHPLVSRAAERARATAAQTRRRDSLLRRHQMQTLMLKRTGSSSCASQSTKRSRHTRSGSSRHYWDLGQTSSVGSGHAMSSALGGWGEV
ncbi:hypothetical protein M409DRAFT_15985 [Zasmidium cellare ATCC 36951]|uniref:Uncharacterized protein n=1 Tax=Zasmidium cellare ATCC 36951 TaxID=1080233 RepID=A0A6A6D2U5_ZASCE|nr:uncharacterized protein M409DRAFT_15985 [Zasmidium cellare ATCC 36951]KAF2173711.1 hypothetical protein M409DRAFT_15985 [Zasmidium cellare ATCC 36951]